MNYPELIVVNAIYSLAKKILKPVIRVVKNRGSDKSTVLFYGGNDEEVAKQAGLNNLRIICNVIVNTNKTIDLCVPKFLSSTLTRCLINAQETKKVRIRVVIHNSENLGNLQQLVKNYIAVKVVNWSRLQHEFLLVDATDNFEEAVALIGCINYEKINYNRANTMIICEKSVVRSLKQEFERVWQSVPYLITDKNAL